MDRILVLETTIAFDSDNQQSKESIITVLVSREDSYEKFTNKSIFPNDSNDQFDSLKTDKNSFSITLYNEIPDKYFKEKNITFIYKDNQLWLERLIKTIDGKEKVIDISNLKKQTFKDFKNTYSAFK